MSTHRAGALERRYRRLLRAYPARYRRERGEEILGTLLEAAPDGQVRPPLRDSRALIMGGLRVRAAQNRRLGTAVSLRLAALLGVALWLGIVSASALTLALHSWMQPGGPGFPPWPVGNLALAGLLTLAAVGTAWFARRAVVVAVALVAAASWIPTLALTWRSPTALEVLLRLAALAALTVLAVGPERPPRAWLCWVVAAGGLLQDTFPAALVTMRSGLEVATVIAAVLWMIVDARPAVAVTVAAGLTGVASYGYFLVAEPFASLWRAPVLARLVLMAGLAALGGWRLRRQTAL